MKLFISYRRDDTGGRAGRLFDVLVSRYGADQVFQDVNAVAPGVVFVDQVDAAIAESDVVLVVIGRDWLSSEGHGGSRRIDDPGDFVRREVRAALEGGNRVVPVLVDDAELPVATELPDELVPLLQRHAVILSDVSWHQDVDELVRRLDDKGRLAARRRGRSALVGVGGLLVATVVTGAVIVTSRSKDSSSSEPPSCPADSSSWTPVALEDDPTLDVVVDGNEGRVEVRSAQLRSDGQDRWLVMLDVSLSNTGEPIAGTIEDDIYYSYVVYDGLLVDGVAQTEVVCFNVTGNAELEPGESAVATIWYRTEIDPFDAFLQLETDPEGVVVVGSS